MLTHQLISLESGSTAEVVRHESDISYLGAAAAIAGMPGCRWAFLQGGTGDSWCSRFQLGTATGQACVSRMQLLSDGTCRYEKSRLPGVHTDGQQ